VKPAARRVLTPQKQVVIKPSDLANAASGFALLQERLTRLGVAPAETRGGSGGHLTLWGKSLSLPPCPEAIICVCCIPDTPMSLLSRRGLRAKTDRLDAITIARVLRKPGKRGWAMFPDAADCQLARMSAPAYPAQ
jgi:hypothetical protein